MLRNCAWFFLFILYSLAIMSEIVSYKIRFYPYKIFIDNVIPASSIIPILILWNISTLLFSDMILVYLSPRKRDNINDTNFKN